MTPLAPGPQKALSFFALFDDRDVYLAAHPLWTAFADGQTVMFPLPVPLQCSLL